MILPPPGTAVAGGRLVSAIIVHELTEVKGEAVVDLEDLDRVCSIAKVRES
jgi:hypothetical protein